MPSSMFPVETRLIPQELIALSQELPAVLANLRRQQRPIAPNESDHEKRMREWAWKYMDGATVYQPVTDFLHKLPKRAKVLMCFQGYRVEDIGTAVIEIESIFWTNEKYPRLDFLHSKKLQQIHGCPNFWGAFILAIMKIPDETQLFTKQDADFSEFIRRARKAATTN